jgi:hypothetical protein
MRIEQFKNLVMKLVKESLDETTDESQMIDNVGKTCTKCEKGLYEEVFEEDDKVQCMACGHEVDRYVGRCVNETEISKKGAKAQLKGLDRKTFKGKVSQVKKKMPGIKDPSAFVASRIEKATGKHPKRGEKSDV